MSSSMKPGWIALLCLLWACWTTPAWAHKPSDSYLTLDTHSNGLVDVAWHIALRDLDNELDLDADQDGQLTWLEVRTRWPELIGYARPHLILSQRAGACGMVAHSSLTPALATHTDGRYAVLRWQQQCPSLSDRSITIAYKLFALTDPTHRGIVRLRTSAMGDDAEQERGIVVMGGSRPAYRMPLDRVGGTADATRPKASDVQDTGAQRVHTLGHFLREGIVHIAGGIDHVLFLVSLLLVAVWQRSPQASWSGVMQGWAPQADWRSTVREVVKLVTAFTLAHSITLGLAAYGVLSPPSRWVESLIAASVAIAVLDNLFPIIRAPRWTVVFIFGLIHGFGFAGALQDLGVEGENLAWPLLGFNLGVELGQLMLVAILLPLAYLMRGTRTYRYGVVLPVSAAIAVLAAIWLVERAADVVILGWAV